MAPYQPRDAVKVRLFVVLRQLYPGVDGKTPSAGELAFRGSKVVVLDIYPLFGGLGDLLMSWMLSSSTCLVLRYLIAQTEAWTCLKHIFNSDP